jgi:hypothetical protein
MLGVTLPSWDLSVSPYIITSPLALVRVLFQRSISYYFVPHLLFIETSLVTEPPLTQDISLET